ncbi:ABC transporter C member 13 [Kickxella alabastrina]|uniref:ABC transporter C member 13 n=1 Tax=Kickxella alabastrina TaxID=61397 RepID=A0ACC1IPP9_9FUNG|nr:ABC transporter C member 13 [Kickxella alabastrina]
MPKTSKDGVAVELDNCAFSWGKSKFGLDPIMLCVKAGEFVTIIGRIGGGKSSLLSGLCGEMPVVGGHGCVCGNIGYVGQKPYIMNDTFRENVLMGTEYDEKWMHQVLEACALSEDVKQFAAGDLSEIGPNGINLSGGQKVRLALARALYLKADVYIFDDLLAAVDAQIERLIIERVLASGGIIGDKTRILVTHAEHLVPLSSKVVTLAEGHAVIVEQQPVDFVSAVNTDEHIPDLSTETASTSNAGTKSGKFTIHPELKDPPFKLWQLWRFIKLSGYGAVAIVALIQLANAYAIYYVESLWISLMVDSNPDTIYQSMSRYLIVNALVGMMATVCIEIIHSGILLFSIRRRLYTSTPVLPGEIEIMTLLSLNVFHRVNALNHISGKFENQIQALLRYYIYTEQLEREASAVIDGAMLEPSWPQNGVIEFCDYSMHYRPELDLVLKGLSFSAQGGEKIGIVGRTGAGKSSITYALMRLVEPANGHIIIDGIDILTIGHYDLRSRIAVIPQDPALFKGTIRDNLDPANEYTDDEVWAAIRAGQISNLLDTPTEKYVKPLDSKNSDKGLWIEGVGLNKWVKHNGINFSVGQKQLISLCRALLWRRRIVILDEATANVDSKTDQIMQEVIRREFKECTVLTIAHRLGTVMESDRILVMDHGQMAEFDMPEKLLADKNGHFSQLIESMNFSHSN